MDASLLLLFGIPVVIWLWLNALGTLAAMYDSTLDPFQRKAQVAIVWVVPFFGAALILYLVAQHSGAIPSRLVPWPFRALIYGKNRARHKHRDDNEESGIDLAISENSHSHSHGAGGFDGGGSGD